MNHKKVLLSAYACSPTKGSEEGNGWCWATGLALTGYEVWCFTSVAYEKEIIAATTASPYPNLHFVFVRLSRYADSHFLNPDSKAIYLHYFLWRRKAAKIALDMHANIQFDIGHHVTYGSLQQGHFLWKLKNLKIIFGPVGGGQKAPAVLKEYFGKAWKYEWIRNIASEWMVFFSRNFKKSIQRSDYLLVTNDETLQMVRKTGYISEDKIHFFPDHAVPPAMEHIQIDNCKKSGTFKLLWVGRILPRKGLNLVLDALSKLPSDFDYILTIVGGGELSPLLPKWIKHYGLDEKKIKIAGQVPFADVTKYYCQSDVFVFCTLRDSFPMQITEAMAFGLPVISLNIQGSALALPDNCGIKITPDSKEATLNGIARAVKQLAQDDTMRKTLSENAFKYTRNNTWKNKIEAVTKHFY